MGPDNFGQFILLYGYNDGYNSSSVMLLEPGSGLWG